MTEEVLQSLLNLVVKIDRVLNSHALAAIPNQASILQIGQVARDQRLRHLQYVSQVADTEWRFDQPGP
jgi:hypothetical protein